MFLACFLVISVENLTHNYALCLLDDLNTIEQKDKACRKSNRKHAIVFIAYDLGASIVKTAISIATETEYKWRDIFMNSAIPRPLLLNAKANPNLDPRFGRLIRRARLRKETKVVKKLIERKANVHLTDVSGPSPQCIFAIDNHDAGLVKLLLDVGASVDDTIKNCGRGVTHIVITPTPDIIGTILKYCTIRRDNCGQTPLMAARTKAILDRFRISLEEGADVNAQDDEGATPLITAIRNNMSSKLIDLYLSQPNINLNLYSKTLGSALHTACHMLHFKTIKKLIYHGSDVNQELPIFRSTPLLAVCIPNEERCKENLGLIDRIVGTLVQAGANVNATIRMPGVTFQNVFSVAAFYAWPGTIYALRGEGASAEARDSLGRQAIHFGAANGLENLRMLRYFLREPERRLTGSDNFEKNCLHWAAQFGRADALELILSRLERHERFKYSNAPDVDGWTPMCWAMRAIIDPTVRNTIGSEPIDYGGTVRCLLEYGARRDIQCKMGKGQNAETFTLLELARLHNASSDLISLVKNGVGYGEKYIPKDDNLDKKTYCCHPIFCGICFSQIYGKVYVCNICHDFYACKKCYGRIDEYHAIPTIDDTETHVFNVHPDYKEFHEPPSPPAASADNKAKRGLETGAMDVSHRLADSNSNKSAVEVEDNSHVINKDGEMGDG